MNAAGVETRPSAIDGLGLFALRSFLAGERLAPYSGPTKLHPPAQTDGPVFTLELRPGLWIDGSGSDNPARSANHSCHPNAALIWDERDATAWLTAQEDIPAGSEVTFDYGFSLADAIAHPCRCGSPDCAGRIVAAPLRPALRRHLRTQGARRD